MRRMLTKALVARKINVPAAAAWSAMSSLGRLHVWFPSIATCRVEGEGVGARRVALSGLVVHRHCRGLRVVRFDGGRRVDGRVRVPSASVRAGLEAGIGDGLLGMKADLGG